MTLTKSWVGLRVCLLFLILHVEIRDSRSVASILWTFDNGQIFAFPKQSIVFLCVTASEFRT
jgi:hypothetical protein